MNYWITTHWPPRINVGESSPGTGVWLPDGRQQAAHDMRAGDYVLVYETKSGRTEIRRFQDGTTTEVPCKPGREGLICYGKIESPVSAIPGSQPKQYVNGTKIWWRWHAPVSVFSRSGFVERTAVLEVLDYNPTYNLHGFGDYHYGLKKINESQFNELVKRFHASRPVELPQGDSRGGSGHGGGGESQIHLNLKQYVASNPSIVLNEVGLLTLGVEYEFPTNDRADIVLVDAHNRVVGVEIEPSVNDSELAGPLQAVKYRYMLECATNRERGDSRAMLIAHSIADEIKTLCERYCIEWHEISREDVASWINQSAV